MWYAFIHYNNYSAASNVYIVALSPPLDGNRFTMERIICWVGSVVEKLLIILSGCLAGCKDMN